MPIDKICEQCQQAFRVKPKNASQKFCSKKCVTAHEAVHGRVAAHKELIMFVCKECSKPFGFKPAYVTSYRNKFGKDPLYCSMPCSDQGRRKDTMLRQRFTCLQCGKEQSRRRKPGGRVYAQQKFCNIECKAAYQRTRALNKFNEGNYSRHIKRHGYVWISVPSLVTGKKHAVMEHRYMMSKHLGRELYPEETVHHKDGNRQNNALENLELFSSRHGPGQRVIDKVQFAVDMLRLYPEFAKQFGVELHEISPVTYERPAASHRPPQPQP